jgi:hypothetical protein
MVSTSVNMKICSLTLSCCDMAVVTESFKLSPLSRLLLLLLRLFTCGSHHCGCRHCGVMAIVVVVVVVIAFVMCQWHVWLDMS